MGVFVFLAVIISLVICFFAAIEFASIAREKGYEDSKYFWCTFLLGIIGMLMVIALPDRGVDYNVVHNEMDKINTFDNGNISNKTNDAGYKSKNEEVAELDTGIDTKNEKTTPTKAILQDGQKICPVCGKVQNYDRKKCWDCGQTFEE